MEYTTRIHGLSSMDEQIPNTRYYIAPDYPEVESPPAPDKEFIEAFSSLEEAEFNLGLTLHPGMQGYALDPLKTREWYHKTKMALAALGSHIERVIKEEDRDFMPEDV